MANRKSTLPRYHWDNFANYCRCIEVFYQLTLKRFIYLFLQPDYINSLTRDSTNVTTLQSVHSSAWLHQLSHSWLHQCHDIAICAQLSLTTSTLSLVTQPTSRHCNLCHSSAWLHQLSHSWLHQCHDIAICAQLSLTTSTLSLVTPPMSRHCNLCTAQPDYINSLIRDSTNVMTLQSVYSSAARQNSIDGLLTFAIKIWLKTCSLLLIMLE